MSHVNVENAKSIGDQILKQMAGKAVKDHTFKMKEQRQQWIVKLLNMDKTRYMLILSLLFQRLVIFAKESTEDMASIFKCELSVFPMALFEFSGFMRKANRLVMANAIYKFSNVTFSHRGSSLRHFDGGALL